MFNFPNCRRCLTFQTISNVERYNLSTSFKVVVQYVVSTLFNVARCRFNVLLYVRKRKYLSYTKHQISRLVSLLFPSNFISQKFWFGKNAVFKLCNPFFFLVNETTIFRWEKLLLYRKQRKIRERGWERGYESFVKRPKIMKVRRRSGKMPFFVAFICELPWGLSICKDTKTENKATSIEKTKQQIIWNR